MIRWAILALFLGIVPARADCMSICLSGHSCELDEEAGRSSSYCTIAKEDCQAECRNSANRNTPQQSRPQVKFGAIAYGFFSKDWATSHDYSSEKEADRSALAACAKLGGKDCKILGWMRNNCGALGVGKVSWGFGLGDRMADAKADALRLCTRGGSQDCSIVASQCAS